MESARPPLTGAGMPFGAGSTSGGPSPSPVRAAIYLAVCALLSSWFALTLSPRENVPLWLALVAVTGAGAFQASRHLFRHPPKELTRWILVGALALRLAPLAAPVSLSDDIHRYVWDGSLVAAGLSPYALRPRDVPPDARPPRPALAELNSPDYYSVYPPTAQLVFAAAASFQTFGLPGERVLRGFLTALDLAAVALLLGLLRRLRHPPRWVLAYAWNPLVCWEVAAGGHTEAVMLPLLLLAVIAATDRRAVRSGIIFGLAASAKLTCLVLTPVLLVFFLRSRLTADEGRTHPTGSSGSLRRTFSAPVRFGAAAAVGLGLPFLPFASSELLPHLFESLALFQREFSFNAPLFYLGRWMLGYREGVTAPVDHLVTPALLTIEVFGVMWVAWRQSGERERLVSGLALAFTLHLLCSRVIHPWYVLPAMALGISSGRVLSVTAAAVFAASYLRYDPLGYEAPWVIALQATVMLTAAAIERRWCHQRSGT